MPFLVQVGQNNIIAGLRADGQNALFTTDLTSLGLDPRAWHHVDISSNVQSQLSGPQPGLVANWHFDEANGTTAVDSSGNGHTATLSTGASTARPPVRPVAQVWKEVCGRPLA